MKQRFFPIVLALTLTLAACKSTSHDAPETATISNEVTTTADVLAVDSRIRLLTLRREDGRVFAIIASDAVRNFDQVDVGDTLKVRYEEHLTATIRPDENSAGPMEAAVVAGRTEHGQKPGVGAGRAVSVSVKIESIDANTGIVVFSPMSGELIAHRVRTDEGMAFLKRLELGDIVQIAYAEALALSIEEM